MAGLIFPSKEVVIKLRRLAILPYSDIAARMFLLLAVFASAEFFFLKISLLNYKQELQKCLQSGIDWQVCSQALEVFKSDFYTVIASLLAAFFLAWLVNWGVQNKFLITNNFIWRLQLKQSLVYTIIAILGNLIVISLMIYLSFHLMIVGTDKLITSSVTADYNLSNSVGVFWNYLKKLIFIVVLVLGLLHYAAAWLRFCYEIALLPEDLTKAELQTVNKIAF